MIKVHLRAPTLSLSGYGIAARQLFDYLIEDGRFEVFLESINWGKTPFIHNHPKQMKYYEAIHKFQAAQKSGTKFDIAIHHSIPNEFSRTAQVNIGYTAGIEVDRITKEWILKSNEMDMLIVPSQFSKNVFLGTEYAFRNNRTGETGNLKVEKPIFVIPHWFDEPENISPMKLGLETDVNLLHVGLWGNKGNFGEDRKNIADLVRLFYQTFHKRKESVGLVLKTATINNSPEDRRHTLEKLESIKKNFGDPKNCKVYLLQDSLTDRQMWELYKSKEIHGFITLTHGEGFGLPILEAQAAGLPVIATDWSGHKDFLKESRGFLPLNFELVEIPDCQVWEGVIMKGSRWAKVNDAHVSKRLRKFVKDYKKFGKSVNKNRKFLEENFSKKAVSDKWKEFFSSFIVEEGPSRGNTAQEAAASGRMAALRKAAQDMEDKFVLQEDRGKRKCLYVMPRSTGDVLISTSIVNSLLSSRHFDEPFYFATSPQYKDLLKGLEETYSNFRVIDFDEAMMQNELVTEVWEYVYNPGVNVQYNFSNWLLGNGEYAVRLLEEFAKNCNLSPREVADYVVHFEEPEDLPEGTYVTFTPAGSKGAKKYAYWEDVLENIKNMLPGIRICQTGLKTEDLYEGVDDWRGRTYGETAALVRSAALHLSVDTFTAHLAAAVGTPHVVLYGSTSAMNVSPVVLSEKKLPVFAIETSDRNGCKKACYKNECYNKKDGLNCISQINPEVVCQTVLKLVQKINEEKKE